MNARSKFFLASLCKRMLQRGLACPACGSAKAECLDRKYAVVILVHCQICALMFRTPTTSVAEIAPYYQEDYQLGFTTEMPDATALAQLKAGKFRDIGKDFSDRLELLRRLGARPGQRLLDFGWSWGCGSWQFEQAGYEVQSFEISQPRADYARTMLNVNVKSALSGMAGQFDIFFSAHVMEHVPNPAETIRSALERLKPGGLFMALTPNGLLQQRAANPEAWHQAWGLNHPNMLGEVFYARCFTGLPQFYAANPYGAAQLEDFAAGKTPSARPLEGGELLCAVRKTKTT